ncbi:membrane biogenesis protein [Candidatus Pacearchaeota archaeon]|nr:membrane biogenesis protein [Candidatus Pacearchaeota archaeon]
MAEKFYDLFRVKKPIIGMIHLAGDDSYCKITRALQDASVFNGEGVDGAIVEDFHPGSFQDVLGTLDKLSKTENKIVLGVNFLQNPYSGFELANLFDLKFVQFDNVQTPGIDLRFYREMRSQYPGISVLGGVRFKYARPSGNSLETDLREGMKRCEAIVTTGAGTGMETPIEKLREFKEVMGNYPLIVGAGVTAENVCEQLSVADGAIVGSYFKNGNAKNPVDARRVKNLMSKVLKLR